MAYFILSILLDSVSTSLILMFNYRSLITDFLMIFINKVINWIGTV
jgi:hypothetical protein